MALTCGGRFQRCCRQKLKQRCSPSTTQAKQSALQGPFEAYEHTQQISPWHCLSNVQHYCTAATSLALSLGKGGSSAQPLAKAETQARKHRLAAGQHVLLWPPWSVPHPHARCTSLRLSEPYQQPSRTGPCPAGLLRSMRKRLLQWVRYEDLRRAPPLANLKCKVKQAFSAVPVKDESDPTH